MRRNLLPCRRACLAALILAPILPGCSEDMWTTSRVKPLAHSPTFGDGRSSRPLVAGTVSREDPARLTAADTGLVRGMEVTAFPVPVTRALVDRGHRQFDIFCSPCHGRTGDADGMIVQRGFPRPPSYFTDRLMHAPVGHFFDVISNGYGLMYSYADRVSPADRWAITAYIRALQRSRAGTIQDVQPAERRSLEGSRS